ncbi:hypothetical protein ONZ45_g13506 [Pleurotus djamor]|nr:hypothetical protein ONZ45_g13506 [Pleurotus djamor]
MASATLSIAVAHAVSFLTRPLILAYPATTIIRLQLILEANLIASFSASWVPTQPLRGSGRRCMTLSPSCMPPRPIYAACLAAGIQWFDWMLLLGANEFDLFVDPGCVSVRFGGNLGQIVSIWSDELPSPAPFNSNKDDSEPSTTFCPFTPVPSAKSPSKTLAQQLLEQDKEEEDSIFAMIADEVAAPTWMTPILDQFPVPSTLASTRSSSPLSATSEDSIDSMHSRSSSRSSFSVVSAVSSATSVSTASSVFTNGSNGAKEHGAFKQSRRERARQARVFIDTNKKEVTPYDGGKTTVLTGGVMLGGAPKPAAPKPAMKNNRFNNGGSWRAARA